MLGFVPRSLAVVGIAGVLVFAVPVHSQALINPVTTGVYVVGAVRAAAPIIAAGSSVGPAGTLLVTSAVALGALAYMTRDTWMPWVAGTFGAGGNQSAGSAPGVGTQYGRGSAWDMPVVDPVPGGVMSVTLRQVSSVSYASVYERVDFQCKSSAGAIVNSFIDVVQNMPTGTVKTVSTQCAGMATPQFLQTSVWASKANNYATANQVSWGQSFDPKTGATYTVSADCVKPDGTTATITATTANPGGGGLLVPSCVAAFGPGARGASFTVSGAPTGGTPQVLSVQKMPTDAETGVLYPNCVGVGAIACTYVVEYQGIACTVGQSECVNWTLRELSRPADYQCKYGPYAISITHCAIAERVYEVNGTRLTEKNTDGDPWTYDSPAPAGMPEVAPAPGTGANPVPGTGVVPGGATGVTPSPVGAPKTNGDCWSGGAFSWNPVDWVLTPIKCGLSWAFIPAAVDTTGVRTQLDRAGIAPSIAALSTAVSSLGGDAAGCTGPTVNFDVGTVHQAITPFAACTEPMSTVAGYAYALISVVTVIGGASKIVSAIGAGFGFGGPPPTWQQGTLF